MPEESTKNEVMWLWRMSPFADNPPKPWHRRVFHGGTTGFARGVPFYGSSTLIDSTIILVLLGNYNRKRIIISASNVLSIAPQAFFADKIGSSFVHTEQLIRYGAAPLTYELILRQVVSAGDSTFLLY